MWEGRNFTAISSLGQHLHVNFGTKSERLFRMKPDKQLRKESELFESWVCRKWERDSARPHRETGGQGRLPGLPPLRGQEALAHLGRSLSITAEAELWCRISWSSMHCRSEMWVLWLWNTTIKWSILLPIFGLKARAGEERIANAPRNSLSAWGPHVCQLDSSSSLDLIH